MIQIITDSTADLPPQVAEAAGVWVVPLSVRFGSEVYRDGIDMTGDEFYGRLLKSATLPSTAAVSPGAFVEKYREALAVGKQVLSIHISSKLSATYSAAVLAAAEFDDDRIAVVDSRSASLGLGLLVLRAAAAARGGASLAEVRDLVEGLKPHVHIYVALDTLENLYKGGRIGRASVMMGTLLSIKPIITVIDGEVAPVERVRTMGRALNRLVDLVRELSPVDRIAVVYTDVPETARHLRDMVQSVVPDQEILICQAGPAIGTYIGHGAVAVMFLRRT
jgi:DegV family protein with EDD domain